MKKTKEQWEEDIIISLVKLRDYFLEQEKESLTGEKRSQAVEGLISAYFGQRRKRVPIPLPSPYMNCETMAEFINDFILSYIYDERQDLLDQDWKQMFVIKSSDNNLFTDFF